MWCHADNFESTQVGMNDAIFAIAKQRKSVLGNVIIELRCFVVDKSKTYHESVGKGVVSNAQSYS